MSLWQTYHRAAETRARRATAIAIWTVFCALLMLGVLAYHAQGVQ